MATVERESGRSADVGPATDAGRVRVLVQSGVAVVALSRPEKLNGLDFPMMDALVSTARELAHDTRIRAVILHGEGPAFCAGLDFASVGRQPRRMKLAFLRPPWRDTNHFQEVAWAWRRLPMPVIAVLHGRCYGGGVQIALAADFRISTADCELSVMEAKWGLIPDMTGSVTLSELVGIDVAKRLAMTGEIIDGRAALGLGLVSEVAEDPLARAEELAAQLAQRSPDAVAATKALMNRTRHRSPRAALRVERMLQLPLLRGANHRIARTAGLAREIPVFRDRGARS